MSEKQNVEASGLNRAKPYQLVLFPLNNGATNVYYVLVLSYIATFGSNVLALGLMFASIMVTAMRLCDAITDPIIGALIDRTNGKFGKFRPFMVIGNLIMAVSIILLYIVTPYIPADMMPLRYVVFVLLYFVWVIGYTFQTSCTRSGQTVLTNDPKQRPFVTFVTTVYQYIGPILVNTILAFAVLPKYDNQYNVESLSEACVIFIITAFIFVMFSFIGLHRIDTPEILGEMVAMGGKQTKVGIKEIVNIFKENVPMRCYLVTGITDKIASNSATQTIVLTMLNGILIANYKAATMITNAGTIISFVFVFLGGVYIAKKGVKVATKVWSAVNIFINIAIFAFLLYLGPTGMAQIGKGGVVMMVYVVFTMGVNASKMILNVAEGMMRADVIDYELERSGNYMPGTVGAVYSLTEKIIASFGSTIAAVAVAAIGYKTVMPQMGDAATWPIFWVTVILTYGFPILGWLCNIIAMKFYELDYDRMAEIQENIAEMKKQKRK